MLGVLRAAGFGWDKGWMGRGFGVEETRFLLKNNMQKMSHDVSDDDITRVTMVNGMWGMGNGRRGHSRLYWSGW